MRNITESLKVLALALALSIGISYVSAWTAPTVTPPNGNVAAPINVSSTAQTKTGDLTVNKITAPTSCIGADCRTAWPSGGDNLGNHTATQALNMGTNGIIAGGSGSTYGATAIQGSKNGWSGINFKDVGGNNSGTLMMHPSYSGFYNASDNNWRMYVDNAGNSYQPGYVNATDVWLSSSGKWASQAGGGLNYATTIQLGYIRGGDTDQTFNCPAGYVVTGLRGGGDGGGGGEVEFVFVNCTKLQ